METKLEAVTFNECLDSTTSTNQKKKKKIKLLVCYYFITCNVDLRSSQTFQRNVITIFKDQGVLDTWRWWWYIPSKCQGSVTLLLSITWILNISAAGTSILQIILHHVLYSILMNKNMHEVTCIWFTFVWAFTPTPSTQMFTFNIQV